MSFVTQPSHLHLSYSFYPYVFHAPILIFNPSETYHHQGFIVLCGSLELSSRNIVAGAVRLCFAVMYALFLGFGLAMGANVYESVSGKGIIGPEDYSCSVSHPVGAPWWQRTASNWYGEYFFECFF